MLGRRFLFCFFKIFIYICIKLFYFMITFISILKFISLIIFVVCFFSYINCLVVDIGSAIASTRTMSPTGADDAEQAKKYAGYRFNLSLIMGVTLAIILCI